MWTGADLYAFPLWSQAWATIVWAPVASCNAVLTWAEGAWKPTALSTYNWTELINVDPVTEAET